MPCCSLCHKQKLGLRAAGSVLGCSCHCCLHWFDQLHSQSPLPLIQTVFLLQKTVTHSPVPSVSLTVSQFGLFDCSTVAEACSCPYSVFDFFFSSFICLSFQPSLELLLLIAQTSQENRWFCSLPVFLVNTGKFYSHEASKRADGFNNKKKKHKRRKG